MTRPGKSKKKIHIAKAGPRDAREWIDDAARVRREDPVLSPCIGVCVMDAQSGLCTGCLRSLDEIAAWSSASEDQRRLVKSALPSRRGLVKNAA